MSKTELVGQFFSNTDQYIKSNPIIKLRAKIVHDLLGECTSKKIVDIGCGNGALTLDYIYNNQITFVDISENMLSLVKKSIPPQFLENAQFIKVDFLKYQPEIQFDIAICFGVIAHVDDVEALIIRLGEVLEHEGLVILQFTASEKIISIFNLIKSKLTKPFRYKYQINIVRSKDIISLVDKHGFEIVSTSKYIPVSPLLSIFRGKIREKLLNYFYSKKFFSFLGSEKVLLLKYRKY